jgi:hypothetical protein
MKLYNWYVGVSLVFYFSMDVCRAKTLIFWLKVKFLKKNFEIVFFFVSSVPSFHPTLLTVNLQVAKVKSSDNAFPEGERKIR